MKRNVRNLLVVGFFSIFLPWGILALHAVAQTSARAGGIDPSKLPDIEGIHLGMSIEQASAVMEALFPAGPNHTLTVTAGKFQNAPDKPWLTGMTGSVVNACTGCGDQVIVRLNTPPNPQQVVSVQRGLLIQQGKEPTVDTTLAGLRQEYGQETAKGNYDPNRPFLAWLFDEQGQHLPSSTPKFAPGCAGAIAQPRAGGAGATDPYATPFVLPNNPVTPKVIAALMVDPCRSHVYVRAELTLTGPGLSLVKGVAVYMSENDLDTRDVIAAQQYLDSVAAAKKQQELKNAQQQAAPKL